MTHVVWAIMNNRRLEEERRMKLNAHSLKRLASNGPTLSKTVNVPSIGQTTAMLMDRCR